MSAPRVVVLGGGPAGCGAAYQLRRTGRASVTLLERQDHVGGNAGSFEWGGQRLDFGSHRLHYTCDAEILADIRRLLEGDLLERVRNGRIRLRGKMVRFPFKPADLLTSLDRGFAARTVLDMIAGALGARRGALDDSFAAVLLRSLGPTICREFYFPYARKIWGVDPDELSATQARRRVTANSFAKLLRRIVKPVGAGRFYYPRRGYGSISTAYADAARGLGAELLLETSVVGLDAPTSSEQPWCVHIEQDGQRRSIEADHVWSTLPVTLMARMVRPAPPQPLLDAAARLDYRAMILVYLQLDVPQFTPIDAHYFPEAGIAITRLSEPKNYSDLSTPEATTVLCAELPCAPGDAEWSLSDEELGALVSRDIVAAGLPLSHPPDAVHVRRLRFAYPIYRAGYEGPLQALDDFVASQPRLLTFGRQGLFAHDNTHHALYMAYAAVECLTAAGFDERRWAAFREIFATHVVED